MKSIILFITISLFMGQLCAQKWSEMTEEQKMMKLKTFRNENQKYLKETLGMSPTQMTDIDNVNICYLSTLDRINRYGKTDADKEKYGDAAWNARWAQLDAIMGVEKHDKYAEYLKKKLQEASK